MLRDLPCRRIQVDEIWSFVYAKQKNVANAKAAPDLHGRPRPAVRIERTPPRSFDALVAALVSGRQSPLAPEHERSRLNDIHTQPGKT